MEAAVALNHLHILVNVVLSDMQRKFCCGSLLPVFGVRVVVKFKLTCVHLILVQFRLLSGNLLGNSCSPG